MWRLRRSVEGEIVVLRLSGRIEGEQLVELKELVASELEVKIVVLDLEEVKLVDQDAVTFLAGCQTNRTQLRNCPAYIREWITREQGGDGTTR